MNSDLPMLDEQWRPRPVHKLTQTLGMGAAGGTVIVGVGLGAAPLIFLDPASMLITVGGTAALLIATFGGDGVFQAIRTLLSVDGTRPELAHSAAFFLLAAACSLGTGALGVVIGLVQLLASLNEATQVAPALATTLLTVFYSLCQAIPALAASVAVARREPTGLPASGATAELALTVVGGAAIVGPVVAMVLFLLL